jgi:hypothetical protein
MAPLKENIRGQLKKYHLSRDNAITIPNLIRELIPIRTNDREVRDAIRQLNLEGVPILTTIHPPYGVYWASSEEEVNEYLANLGSRMKAILERMSAINRIKANEFLKGQLEMF